TALDKLAGAMFADGRQQTLLTGVPQGLGKPVLVIWGEQDRIIPASHAPEAAGLVRVEVLAGQGHMAQMEAAGDINRLIEGFLE
ncbi:MAG: acetoin dehydrogenase dihydrolipoyllysine-residue acetyltransferase subunit, partial [Rhodocyclaceae bacterium]|nr:acetoin dehydrogenase dihydrolipoyllysine-residue acetyltransferase subunit [Rhodocyclaceae bacterium]